MANSEINLHQKLWDKKQELQKSINDTLETLGIEMELESVHLQVKHVRSCPPGYELVFEPVEHPDGSVTYQWICKKS